MFNTKLGLKAVFYINLLLNYPNSIVNIVFNNNNNSIIKIVNIYVIIYLSSL